jgi:hypothetical protein
VRLVALSADGDVGNLSTEANHGQDSSRVFAALYIVVPVGLQQAVRAGIQLTIAYRF